MKRMCVLTLILDFIIRGTVIGGGIFDFFVDVDILFLNSRIEKRL
jgi:hypothetical protein